LLENHFGPPRRKHKAYCFLQAADISKDMEVSFVWFHEEKEIFKAIPPMKMTKRWRTCVDKNLRGLKGDSKVKIKGMDGNLLKNIKFEAGSLSAKDLDSSLQIMIA
jgi:hypothetical protein